MSAFTPGQIAKVDQYGRLGIPVDVLRTARWWSGETSRVRAELTRKGLMRLFPDSAKALLRSEERDDNSEAASVARSVIADKYRQLSLYADGRLRLVKEVCPWLGFSLGEAAELYVQSFPSCVEIMSMEFRFERLADVEPLPWEHPDT